MFSPLQIGTPVEVRSTFDRGWKRGFEVAAAEGDSYRLRRLSDGAVLPASFPAEAIRPAAMADGRHFG